VVLGKPAEEPAQIMELATMKVLLVIAGLLACTAMPAIAQSWGRGGAYAGAGGTSQGYYPRSRMHSCTWSATAACSAWRSGVYDDGKGVRHQLVKRFPNGRYTIRVYQGNTRVNAGETRDVPDVDVA
jgi:hypothetical protein